MRATVLYEVIYFFMFFFLENKPDFDRIICFRYLRPERLVAYTSTAKKNLVLERPLQSMILCRQCRSGGSASLKCLIYKGSRCNCSIWL